eukprot:gene25829-32325_t
MVALATVLAVSATEAVRALPILSEYLIESNLTKTYYYIDQIGGWGYYSLYFVIYLSIVEVGIYWMHRTLHTNKFLYKYIHALHHKYNKQITMTPWCSIAFNPIDGILQASPYVITLFFVPMHYFTHLFLIFFSGMWATNIHDAIWGDSEPIMGAKYHLMHHTHYHYNFGQFFIFCDYIFGSLKLTCCNSSPLSSSARIVATTTARGTKPNSNKLQPNTSSEAHFEAGERLRNPERLNLDRRQLEISTLDGPLSTVKGLRVLMAGKNKIGGISNLTALRKLDVLDLHSNEIRAIEGLEGLSDLRVLNLAELNLRRNHIDCVTGLNKLPALQRVFLSHNQIRSVADMACLFEVSYLIELSLDGNPLSEADPVRYRAELVHGMAGLRHLDLKRITDEERAAAAAEVGGGGAVMLSNRASPLAETVGGEYSHWYEQQDSSGVGNIAELNSTEARDDGQFVDKTSASRGEVLGSSTLDHVSNQAALSSAQQESRQTQQFPRVVTTESVGDGRRQSVSQANASDHFVADSASLLQTIRTDDKAAINQSNANVDGSNLVNGKFNTTLHQQQQQQQQQQQPGLAALARSGRLSAAQSIFDLEIIGPDEKALIAVGDAWDWPPGRQRLLLNVSEASLYHMRRETIISRFGAQQLACMPALRLLRLVGNDFHTLAHVDFVCEQFGATLEHLVLRDNPINLAAGSLLRQYLIAAIPSLLSVNETPITAEERRSAESLYLPLKALQRGSSVFSVSRMQRGDTKIGSTDGGAQQHGRKHVDTSSTSASLSELTQTALIQRRLRAEFELDFEQAVRSVVRETLDALAVQRR